MIQGHEKIRLPDVNNAVEFTAEVNWNPKDKQQNDCKMVRFTLGGKQCIIRKEHLVAFLFAIGTMDEQKNLIPTQITRIRNYETMLGITATKDIRKGQKINVHVKIPIPISQDDVIAASKSTSTIIGNK